MPPRSKAGRGLTILGHLAALPASPGAAVLERVANPQPRESYVVRFAAPEFTTLCPVTGQPDFAHLVIDYVPRRWLVESKSLKLYLASFRNHSGFHEDCTVTIGRRIADLLGPRWLLESKSLKLYIASFRSHGAFHEDCTVMIGKRIADEIKPKWLRIGGYWYPRGGIPIDVFWQTGELPKNLWLPDQGVAPYRPRG